MSVILLVLAIFFKSVLSACSDKTTETDCTGETKCDWKLEDVCGVFTSADCGAGCSNATCSETPAVQGSCSDTAAGLSCPGKTNPQCTVDPDCTWPGIPVCENPSPLNNCNYVSGSGTCPTGCNDVSTYVCQHPAIGGGCGSYGTTPLTSECVYLTGGCKDDGTSCIVVGGYHTAASCAVYSRTVPASECTSDGLCVVVSGSSCGVNTALITSLGESPNHPWIVNMCATRSILPISDCTRHSQCKISAGVCMVKTQANLCSEKSTTPISPCEQYSQCCQLGSGAQLGQCVASTNALNSCGGSTVCGPYSTTQLSECAQDLRCDIVSGACTAYPCQLDAAPPSQTCDSASNTHGCTSSKIWACSNVDCTVATSAQCGNSPYSDANCNWSLTGTCLSTNTCPAGTNGECLSTASPGCTNTSYTPAQCNPPSPPTAGTCTALTSSSGCDGQLGCKWRPNGGKCVDKSQSAKPPFPWWVIGVAAGVVVVIVVVVVTLVVMKVKKVGCFKTAKVVPSSDTSSPAVTQAEAESADKGAVDGTKIEGEVVDTSLPAGGAETDVAPPDAAAETGAPPPTEE